MKRASRKSPKSSVVKKTVSLSKEVFEKAEAGAKRQMTERAAPSPNLSAYIASLIVRDAQSGTPAAANA